MYVSQAPNQKQIVDYCMLQTGNYSTIRYNKLLYVKQLITPL